MFLEDSRYQGAFDKNPFNFTNSTKPKLDCTANRVPVPKASIDKSKKYEIFNLLMNASGKKRRDAYLLDPDNFEEGFFAVPVDLTAVQDGGQSETPLLDMLVNMLLTFSTGLPSNYRALFFYNTDKCLVQVDNLGTFQGPILLSDTLV